MSKLPMKAWPHYSPNSQLYIIETNTKKGCRYKKNTTNANRLANQKNLTICELMQKLHKSLKNKLPSKILMLMKFNFIFNDFFL